jgi:hypothetical protein
VTLARKVRLDQRARREIAAPKAPKDPQRLPDGGNGQALKNGTGHHFEADCLISQRRGSNSGQRTERGAVTPLFGKPLSKNELSGDIPKRHKEP